ncbi:MAG TPA: CHRD domain-containing protein [Jiangellales bacterium]|nr:CHRD domain-containing protein [Jiangellales bacterium]
MITRRTRQLVMAIAVSAAVAATTAASAATAGGDSRSKRDTILEQLTGYEEDSLTISTTGTGQFRAKIDERRQEITYRLSYARIEGGAVTQAHIHFGLPAQSGGISVFLCTNLGNGPAGTQACPPAPATITGTIRPADVIGPTGQGIAAGEFDELVDAIRAEATYVNVHTEVYQAGEIRAQLEPHHP